MFNYDSDDFQVIILVFRAGQASLYIQLDSFPQNMSRVFKQLSNLIEKTFRKLVAFLSFVVKANHQSKVTNSRKSFISKMLYFSLQINKKYLISVASSACATQRQCSALLALHNAIDRYTPPFYCHLIKQKSIITKSLICYAAKSVFYHKHLKLISVDLY